MVLSEVFPVFLRLRGRGVVVAGGGDVAERKVRSLLDAGADVHVVAPETTEALRSLANTGAIRISKRRFEDRDLDGVWFVVACTDDPAVQRTVADACDARRLFCLAVDDVAHASAFGGSVVRRPPFLIAISSSGKTPALTRLVREILESALPPSHWVRRARELRRSWKERGVPMEDRFLELVRALHAPEREAGDGHSPNGT